MLSENKVKRLVMVNKSAGLSFEAIYNRIGRVTNFTRAELLELYSVSPSVTCFSFASKKIQAD